jgi:hypothetical protein
MRRLAWAVPAAVSLLFALDAGLFRIGWPFPLPSADLPLAHGPLMVSGFLGTLISLEKAVALGRRWAYAGPSASGLGGVWLAIRTDALAPRILFVFAGLSLAFVALSFLRRHRTAANAFVLGGSLLWLSGNALWLLGWPVFAVVPCWIGFLHLTIAGERLELNRLMRPSRASRTVFFGSAFVALAGIALASTGPLRPGEIVFGETGTLFASSSFELGVRLLGLALAASGLWLLSNDMARLAIRKPGLSRFMAVSLLFGYAWLVTAGALWLVHGPVVGGALYDAVLHAFFLGFAFSMIFAHGPVIFPAIAGRSIDFHGGFYVPLALLNASLALRLFGDFTGHWRARPWGGLLNAASILLFLVITAAALVLTPRSRPQ